MIAAIAATKADLTEWVYEQGLTALHLLLREDAERSRGRRASTRRSELITTGGARWGAELRRSSNPSVLRPRVRSKSGEEASLPHCVEAFREEDPLPERVLNQILVGVSTRNYESSLDKPSAKLKSRGTSKSAASRHLVSQTTKKLEEYLSRRLEEFELAALMMDGLEVAGQTVVDSRYRNRWNEGALGYMAGLDGKLSGVHRDVAEPSRAGIADRRIDFSASGRGKGIRKALVDVLGDLAVIRDASSTNSEIYARTFPSPVPCPDLKEAYKCH